MTTDTDKASDKLVEMALKAAFEKGWCAAAQWAQRDDLRHDTGSIAYAGQRDAILAGKAAEVRAAIIADLCGDVEPVAWVYWHPSDTTYDGPDTLHKKAVSRFTDDTRKAMMAKGWLFEPLYPASTVAALKSRADALAARVAELEKDAGRYRLLRRGQKWSVIDGIGTVLRAEELDDAIDVALAAKGQA